MWSYANTYLTVRKAIKNRLERSRILFLHAFFALTIRPPWINDHQTAMITILSSDYFTLRKQRHDETVLDPSVRKFLHVNFALRLLAFEPVAWALEAHGPGCA